MISGIKPIMRSIPRVEEIVLKTGVITKFDCPFRNLSSPPAQNREFPNANSPESCPIQTGEDPPPPSPGLASTDRVKVTHPFHLWSGQRFPIQHSFTTWNVPLVRCIVGKNKFHCLPRSWTSLREVDDFERVSAGRAYFRIDDLVALRAV